MRNSLGGRNELENRTQPAIELMAALLEPFDWT
jgi:hypothetical protein